MGLRSNFKIARRTLFRRKSKNASAILAIAMGVTLMVGVQITTETLSASFLTSTLLSQGEVDIRVTNASTGAYLAASEEAKITNLIPNAVGIMPELTILRPVSIGPQFEPSAEVTGIPLDYPAVFGSFYDWRTGKELNIDLLLTENTSALLSSELAENLGLNQSSSLPVILRTEFTNITVVVSLNQTTFEPIITTLFRTEKVEFSIVGIYDSNRPGIGAQTNTNAGRLLLRLDQLQTFVSWQDPFRNTDIVETYLISLKSNHFAEEIEEDVLQEQVDNLLEATPEVIDPMSGISQKIYNINSFRLTFFGIAVFFITLLNAFLTTLGLLIMITGLLLITNVQLLAVEDKQFQTGVLRAIGEKRMGIFIAHLFETVFQGIIGGLVGLFGGLIFGTFIAFYLGGLFGTGDFSVTPVVKQEFVLLAVVIGVILAIITGILPGIRAARVNVVEALRGIKTQIEEKPSRNLLILGLFFFLIGLQPLVSNGLLSETNQFILDIPAGWDSLGEIENNLLYGGLTILGLGIIATSSIEKNSRKVIVLNVMAFLLWALPIFSLTVALDLWVEDFGGGSPMGLLLYSIIWIVIGSVLIVGLNLGYLMKILRSILIRFNWSKGVGQIAPSLISSHKVRSTLTFAIFAVILTLNVTIATLVAGNQNSTIGQAGEDSRGVDLSVQLSKPENASFSYADELLTVLDDDRVEDILQFKTCDFCTGTINAIALADPFSPDFDRNEDFLPVRYIELQEEQIRGDATDASDVNWRYDFYLDEGDFPDGIRESYTLNMTDAEVLDLSRQSWDLFFDPSYQMQAYNTSGNFGGFGGGFGPGPQLDPEQALKDENGTAITNPMIFADVFFLPLGSQIWIAMNSTGGTTNWQAFTVGGMLDSQRAGGFPLSVSGFGAGAGAGVLGSIYLPGHWSPYTNFFGEADGISPFSRKVDQFDSFLLKTSLDIDDPQIDDIAQAIEAYTNTDDTGYRALINDDLITASAIPVFTTIEENLALGTQFTAFLQIYVSFGLVIGAVGMGIISVRNVAERKREIGMMRSIGFSKIEVIASVLLELFVLGLIGLVLGVTNGLLINVGFSSLSNSALVIPWDTIFIYLAFISAVTFLAGALPGWKASRIPPSEALRYVG